MRLSSTGSGPLSAVIFLPILVTAGCAPTPSVLVPMVRPNVLLVSMDTVRYDHTSLGGGRDTTPNLARLAARGVSYDNCFSPGNESLYSHTSVFTGRYPSEVAVPDYKSYMIPDGTATIASVLSAYGYKTGAFTGGGHVVAGFGFDHGFDVFKATGTSWAFGTFFDTVPPAAAWIDTANRDPSKPWFAFVHGYDAHTPYVSPGPFAHYYGTAGKTDQIEEIVSSAMATEQLRGNLWFRDRATSDFVHATGRPLLGTDFYSLPPTPLPGERVVELTDAEVTHLRDHYDSGIAYADTWLGLLLSHVDLENTLVVVFSDHGEDLLDHGYVNHRAGLWDSTTHVPLVVSGPGFTGGERRAALVDLRDVVPTILRVVGANPMADASGSALQDQPLRSAAFSEGVMDMVSVRTADARLVLRQTRLAKDGAVEELASRSLGDGNASFYDIKSDPTETNDLLSPDSAPSAASLARASALRDLIVGWRRALHQSTTTGAPVPEAVREALRKNGYWVPEEVSESAAP